MGNTGTSLREKLNEWSIYMGLKSLEARVLFLGLDAAGKTTLLYRMKLGEVVTTIPTIGFNVETVKHSNIHFTVWDVGGRDKIRALYRHYFENTQALVFIVDSNDRERMTDAKDELHRFAGEDELRDCPLLVLANKQDLPNAMSVDEMKKALDFDAINLKVKNLMPLVATTGEGINDAMDWLTYAVRKPSKITAAMDPINETIEDVKKMVLAADSGKDSAVVQSNSWNFNLGSYVKKIFAF